VLRTEEEVGVFNGSLSLRQLFAQSRIIKCAGAHNAAVARVAEITGFDAVWSSSFEISASYCVPDSSILSMSEFLHIAESMSRSVTIPVIADCDTGYGNPANVSYAVKRFETAGIAGISIEDQLFPKVNSLIRGPQRLVSIAEFRDKINAAKQTQVTAEFMVIARVQALIAGAGQAEALLRAHEYAAAGADAILIHWNGSSVEPVQRFLKEWTQDVPVVVIPTSYYRISLGELENLGVKMVIYANHGMRSALTAMEETFRTILRDGTTTGLETSLWPVERIFEELQGPITTRDVLAQSRLPPASAQLATGANGRKRRVRSDGK